MKIEVSNGELIDKITILEIKRDKIKDIEKLENVIKELNILSNYTNKLMRSYDIEELYDQLMLVNETLWDIEDQLREREKINLFDERFIELARMVYITNDRRAQLKRQINEITGSELIEEKSYKEY